MSHDATTQFPVSEESCACGGCGCAEGELGQGATPIAAALPTDLDVSAIPPELREARVYGSVASLVPGELLILAAAEDPSGLVSQIEAETSGDLSVVPLQSGPPVWRVSITRLTCC